MSQIEICQVGDNEYRIGTNRIVFIDKKIIHISVVGDQTKEMSLLHRELDNKLLSLTDEKCNYLIDLNKVGNNNPESRLIWKESCYIEKINKVAVYGLHSVARVIASFVIGFDKKSKQRFFKTEKEAIKWLIK
jgi:hypothetical protein